MRIFSVKKNRLSEIRERPVLLEREIQSIVEENLHEILKLEFVSSEFMTRGFRVDTLAFDQESNAFVIIEYKRDKNYSIIDQGISYMNLMLNNQADFILENNEKTVRRLSRKDVDWSQSRIIFISTEFNKYQQYSIGFRDLGIRLYEIKKYDNDMFVFREIIPIETSKSITTITKSSSIVKRVSEVIKTYTEEDVLAVADEKTKLIYSELKTRILDLGDDVEVRPTKKYIAYRRNHGFASFVVLKKVLKIYLNIKLSSLNDPMKIARDVQRIGHYAHGDTEVIVKNTEEIPYAVKIVAQSYKDN